MHRKNSSESSDEMYLKPKEVVAYQSEVPEKDKKQSRGERKTKRQRSKTDGFVSVKDEVSNNRSSLRKLPCQENIELQDSRLLNHHRPSLQSIESEQSTSNLLHTPRRHSNFTNSCLSFIPISIQTEIKPTGSLELGYIDKNPNQVLTSEGFYFKACPNKNVGVRRIRSTALETCCPPPTLTLHPNSVEIIGANVKDTKNPLPPPSSTLIRNQHLNLCPYYGSEIVYPIAEQSDEHQTSHGPDTDVDSLTHNSDSDYEENNQGSRSPLLVRLQHVECIKMGRNTRPLPQSEKELRMAHDIYHPKIIGKTYSFTVSGQSEDVDRTSATSKDALLDNENSNSSATPEMHDARTDCFATDNECSDKKLSECSNISGSNSSVDCEEMKAGSIRRSSTVRLKPIDKNGEENTEGGFVEAKNDILVHDYRLVGTVRKRGGSKKGRKRKNNDSSKLKDVNFSSLVELDLDWLFDDENEHLKYHKGKD